MQTLADTDTAGEMTNAPARIWALPRRRLCAVCVALCFFLPLSQCSVHYDVAHGNRPGTPATETAAINAPVPSTLAADARQSPGETLIVSSGWSQASAALDDSSRPMQDRAWSLVDCLLTFFGPLGLLLLRSRWRYTLQGAMSLLVLPLLYLHHFTFTTRTLAGAYLLTACWLYLMCEVLMSLIVWMTMRWRIFRLGTLT